MAIDGQKAVIWDMDGVIVDSHDAHMKSWQEAWEKHGIRFTEADFKRVFGMRNTEVIPMYLGKGVSAETISEISRQKEEAFRRLIKGKIYALPGVMKLLAALEKAGFTQALASSTAEENVDLITTTLGIKHYFSVLLSSKDVTAGKPDPQCFLLAAHKINVPPGSCVVIEDAVAGIEAAKRGGMKCIAVTSTHPAEKLKQADCVVRSLEEVTPAVVEKLLFNTNRVAG